MAIERVFCHRKMANLINPSFPSLKLWCIQESFQEPHRKVIANTANLIVLSAFFSDWCPNSLRSWKSSESSDFLSSRPGPLMSIMGKGGTYGVNELTFSIPMPLSSLKPAASLIRMIRVIPSVVVWVRNVPQRPVIWTLSPIGWLCGEVMRWHSLAGRRSSLVTDLESTWVHPSSSLLSAFCLHLRMWSLNFMLWAFPSMLPLLLWLSLHDNKPK